MRRKPHTNTSRLARLSFRTKQQSKRTSVLQ
jgi:hypothetical protein